MTALNIKPRSHGLDGLASRVGSRLIVVDVWVAASADEVAKLENFNMMKQRFFSTPETKTGAGGLCVALIAGGAAWWLDSLAPSSGLVAASGLGLWSACRNYGREGTANIKVKDVVNRAVPFTRDNPADIHEITVQIEEQYQRLFGAMFEIEHFNTVREVVWHKEAYA